MGCGNKKKKNRICHREISITIECDRRTRLTLRALIISLSSHQCVTGFSSVFIIKLINYNKRGVGAFTFPVSVFSEPTPYHWEMCPGHL